VEEWERQLLVFVRQVYDVLNWPGVVVLMAIESACIPLPSEVVMPLSGWMLIKERGFGVLHNLIAGFYGAVGCSIGSLVAYWVGARGGRPLLERYGKYVLITRHDLDRADRWFERYGEWTIFFSRLLPVVRTFISFPAGVARMHLGKFVIYTFVGSFPWCLGLAFGGYQLGEHWEQIRAIMRPFDVPIIIAFLILVALYIRQHIRRALPEREP
jgi:membrane protein DedA with SNARE-associated domain